MAVGNSVMQDVAMSDLFRIERDLWEQGYNRVAGVDEVGRGVLAGPLLAAAVILPKDFDLVGVRDSKELTKTQLATEYPRILVEALAVSVAWISARAMDEAADAGRYDDCHRELLSRAIGALHPQPDFVLIDHYALDLPVESRAMSHGEDESASIAVASMIAKVTRDRMMIDMDQYLPHWGFARHKGYGGGSGEHKAAIAKHGLSPIHRRSSDGVQAGPPV